jgi:hypothetical protein
MVEGVDDPLPHSQEKAVTCTHGLDWVCNPDVSLDWRDRAAKIASKELHSSADTNQWQRMGACVFNEEPFTVLTQHVNFAA